VTPEELVVRGQRAEALLANVDLMSFIEELKELLLEGIGNTEPNEYKLRDASYYEHRALNSLIAHLKLYSETAYQITHTESEAN